jgi:hypothetical protein
MECAMAHRSYDKVSGIKSGHSTATHSFMLIFSCSPSIGTAGGNEKIAIHSSCLCPAQ